MRNKDKDYLIGSGILIYLSYYIGAGFGIIGAIIAYVLANKVKEYQTIKTILKVLAVIEIALWLIYVFA